MTHHLGVRRAELRQRQIWVAIRPSAERVQQPHTRGAVVRRITRDNR